MQITFERFMHMQEREIKKYREEHRELPRQEAAIEWMRKYASMFRKWFNLFN